MIPGGNYFEEFKLRRHRKVVWNEGMFIAPQHFQQQERYLHHYVEQYTAQFTGGNRYGISTLEIDSHRLTIGKLVISECCGVFPDGTYFESFRELVLDIPAATLEKRVFLALPMSVEGENEYGELKDLCRYSKVSINLFDSSDSSQSSIETTLAEPNVRLVLEGDEITGMTLIPIARVLEKRESGEVILDKGFIPACLQYGASQILVERIKELFALTQARAQSIAQRIGAGQNRKSEQSLMKEYLWLQALNRWLPWLHLALNNSNMLLEELYEGLVRYSAELKSFEPNVADLPEPLIKDDLKAVFSKVFSALRSQLSMVQSDSVAEFKWDTNLFEKRRLLRTSVPNIHLMENRRFVLAVESSIGASTLAQVFPSACTLSGITQIAELVRNGLSGIGLSVLPIAPNELKARADMCYFEIDTGHAFWQEIKNKREAITLHVDSRVPDVALILYALG
ncbi:type VI secretion protein, VC_A0114 family [Marinomonas posidonica IVIA-Po-181]|uniref:Type VI secretion protein, VC_A0114 family n=1 Tax=Marinomonas posidonica (strain CECT 7376 / NCIMB 14433 / IVIA-Po-181) TaxID=491952 RepID=F6D0Z8_MARPP|nr:type VI secretion protein, VC_A0114 family [Marinomonas posidonica IVIA-Po-181]